MDSTTIMSLLTWAVPLLLISVMGLIVWLFKQHIQKADDIESKVLSHAGDIEHLKNTSVTTEQVRSIIHQSNEPIRVSLQGLESVISKQSNEINTVLQHLAERRGYDTAMRELEGTRDGR